MSTKYIASNWRLPNQENSSKSDNYGLTFDGSEFISVGTPLNGLSAFSFSIWAFRSTDQAQYDGIIAYQDNTNNYWKLFFSSSTDSTEIRMLVRPYVNMGDGGNTAFVTSNTGAFPLNQWVHIVVTSDGVNRMKMYINGIENIASQQNRPNTLSQTTNLIIGRDPCCGGRYFDGKLSEVAIFDYALSSTQISTLYGSSSLGAGNPMALKPQPVAYYPLGDNSASNPLTQPNEAVEDASVFEFDGSSHINFGTISGLVGANSASVSLWFKADIGASSTNERILSASSAGIPRDHGPEIRYQPSTNSINYVWGITSPSQGYFSATIDNSIIEGQWYNVIVVLDVSGTPEVKTYLNGDLKTTDSLVSYSMTGSLGNLTIGARPNGTINFNGEISNVAIWNSDQSSEISNIYNSGVPATSYTNTPTAWYKLDQSANWDVSGSGNWTIPDASGNGNDGTSSGMTSANLVLSDLTRAVPYDSYSFNFDNASSDYIVVDNSSGVFNFGTNPFSISLWFNGTTFPGTYTAVLGSHNGSANIWAVYVHDTNGVFIFGNGGQLIGGGGSISTNEWYHYAVTRDTSGNLITYLNGVAVNTATGKTGTFDSSSTIRIADDLHNVNQSFDGKISNVSIFNEGLTSTEVLKLYANGVPQDLSSFSPAPIAWYTLGSNSFFNGTNYICRDLIGSNDGTSANAGVDAIVGDSPRSSANGVGTNNSIPENLEGSTKWSNNNSWSINMSETARVEDTP